MSNGKRNTGTNVEVIFSFSIEDDEGVAPSEDPVDLG
jgi:hypothetical protein